MTFDDAFVDQLPDTDPSETKEWIDSLDAVAKIKGHTRAVFLMSKLMERSHELQFGIPAPVRTPYLNSIGPVEQKEEYWFPGDDDIERRLRAYIRWNAAVMVVKANKAADGIGGHLATFASSAALYDVGFNHFFRGKDDGNAGDHVYIQGHAAPGIYARAYLEGRLTEAQLDGFRRELSVDGLSSYPHPRLKPEFWEYPTVSMGLGPLNSIYHARFNQYLYNRQIDDTSHSRVWCFLGDGEVDEPETLGSISLAARENLDNLIWIVNCNLQRLDGPVRGNGKIIQELEAVFRGSGWNVIKVIWSRDWDPLLARDRDGLLLEQMNETVDGEFQKFTVAGGAYIREHFFGPDPRLRALVEHLSDDDLAKLRRGGHDYRKVYAAYKAATEMKGAPTAVLAKTVKGWTLGTAVEGRNITHQAKKMSEAELRVFRDRLELPIPDSQLKEAPYYHPGPKSEEVEYLLERRLALGGPLPKRVVRSKPLPSPAPTVDAEFAAGSGTAVSTTMVFTRLLRNLLRDKELGPRIVPIIPDEARTFGMDPLFNEVGIYSSLGQVYQPVDSDLVLKYREARDGQVLEEGITEAGSVASLQAAGTSYATHAFPVIPFYSFYSMFGFQRTGDQIWAFADARGRGFLMGGTAGRTTLAGEGLQHDDGHSHILASTLPNVRAYDPAYAYELAAIVRDGIEWMYVKGEDVFYYITMYNENYPQPPRPDGVEEAILRGLYRFRGAPDLGRKAQGARLLGSGAILPQVLAAADLLAERFGVAAEVWSAPSFSLLRRDALEAERWNRLHPDKKARVPYVSEMLPDDGRPIVAATDWLKAVPDLVARWLPSSYVSLGTDGFGRSDNRDSLRSFFEIDPPHVAVAVLVELAKCGAIPAARVGKAIKELGIDPEKASPLAL
jgi:pyruvate dehydrogenase E1 component